MGQIPEQIQEAFFAGSRSADVPFVINDAVHVVVGDHAGRGGAVISLLAMEPELLVAVELEDGSDAELVASQLRLVDDAG